MTLAMSWYLISARKWFKGPRINVTHIEGEAPRSPSSGESGNAAMEKKMCRAGSSDQKV